MVIGPTRHAGGWRAWSTAHPTLLALGGLLVLTAVMTIVSDRFLSWENLGNIGRQVSINAVIACGMTVVIITGGIDLSVGAVMSASMTLTAGAMLAGLTVPVAVALGLLSGLLLGAFNGALVAYARLPAIIVTLASMEMARGAVLLYTGGYPLSGLPPVFGVLGQGHFAGIALPTLIMLAVVGAGTLLLRGAVLGRYFYAIGGNEEAARFSGVPVQRARLLAYTLSGATAALAGIILSSRLMSGQPNAGIGYELDAIAAVVLGGASIMGGRGMMVGTLIGAVTLGILNNGLNLMGVSPYVQKIFKGVVILIAIYGTVPRQR